MCAAMGVHANHNIDLPERKNNSYWMCSRSTFPGGFEDTGTEVKVPSAS
jgi:hypothetical protein